MIGAIIGDIVGAAYEFDNINTKDFEFFSEESGYTDDTVMTCAVAKAILDCRGNYDDLSRTAVKTFREIGRQFPFCGYGGHFAGWMFSDDPKPYNSCGNGSAMRVSPVGYIANGIEEAKELSRKVTEITHNHPEGLKGAEATAVCIVLARQGKTKEEIRGYVEEHYYKMTRTCDEWRREIGMDHGREICQVSVPQAFECFFESESYEDCIRNCVSIGGDCDTTGAIAGGIAAAYYGVPQEFADRAMEDLPPVLRAVVTEWNETVGDRPLR